jgi:hypothetical protein
MMNLQLEASCHRHLLVSEDVGSGKQPTSPGRRHLRGMPHAPECPLMPHQ